jgi:hypothetical protein
VILIVISEVTYNTDTEAIGQMVGGARVEDGVVDDGGEELDNGDVEVDSVTTQDHALESLKDDDEQALAMRNGRDSISSSQVQAAKRRGSNWTAN